VRHGHFGRIRTGGIARQSDFHVLHIADASVAHQFASAMKLLPRALLRSDLEDPPRRFHRIGHVPAFGNGQRGGLLQVHILAGAHRVHGQHGVLVIGRGNHHGVDVFVGQQLVIVAISLDAVVFAGVA
jgi:hypothetical protein